MELPVHRPRTITNAEAIGVEGRGAYYERAGALRDMSRITSFSSFIDRHGSAVSLKSDDVRDEKVRALKTVRPIPADRVDECAVRGQYVPVRCWDRLSLATARNRESIPTRPPRHLRPSSSTLIIGVGPMSRFFCLRKRLQKRVTEIAIHFREVPHRLFTDTDSPLEPNVLVIRIQPNEGITLRFGAKLPGQAMRIRWVNMDFRYGSSFGIKPPEAYERLLLDCMLGDSTL